MKLQKLPALNCEFFVIAAELCEKINSKLLEKGIIKFLTMTRVLVDIL